MAKFKLITAKFLLDADYARMDDEIALASVEDAPESQRASGEIICEHCGKLGYSHPRLDPYYFLHQMCDGRILKF